MGVVVVVGRRTARCYIDRASRTDSKLTSNKAVRYTMGATRDETAGERQDALAGRICAAARSNDVPEGGDLDDNG